MNTANIQNRGGGDSHKKSKKKIKFEISKKSFDLTKNYTIDTFLI